MSDLFDFDPRQQLFAVMGNPVSHSKSPRIHQLFAEQLGLNISYQKIHVDVGGFDQAVSNFQASGGRGLNVTLPFKLEAYELADQLSDRARLAGAVNTLTFIESGRLAGDNTDGIGMLRDITINLDCAVAGERVLMLGAGGAARGVLGPLLDASPAAITVANRTVDRAVALARQFDSPLLSGCGYGDLSGAGFDLIINATSASIEGEMPPLPAHTAAHAKLAYDLMYASEPTAFMRWARDHDVAAVSDGLGMLVEQAAESCHIWHGRRPQTEPVILALRG